MFAKRASALGYSRHLSAFGFWELLQQSTPPRPAIALDCGSRDISWGDARQGKTINPRLADATYEVRLRHTPDTRFFWP